MGEGRGPPRRPGVLWRREGQATLFLAVVVCAEGPIETLRDFATNLWRRADEARRWGTTFVGDWGGGLEVSEIARLSYRGVAVAMRRLEARPGHGGASLFRGPRAIRIQPLFPPDPPPQWQEDLRGRPPRRPWFRPPGDPWGPFRT